MSPTYKAQFCVSALWLFTPGLIERGLEPVYQLTCRGRNRLALQSDLLSAWALGIKNVLCLTGDHPILGRPYRSETGLLCPVAEAFS